MRTYWRDVANHLPRTSPSSNPSCRQCNNQFALGYLSLLPNRTNHHAGDELNESEARESSPGESRNPVLLRRTAPSRTIDCQIPGARGTMLEQNNHVFCMPGRGDIKQVTAADQGLVENP